METEVPYPRFLSRGRCFVYLFPCRERDLQKIGYARDPLVRLNELHRRFFRFFDLERGALVETATVRESRALERALHLRYASERVPAPLEARELAAGEREWFCGVVPAAREAMRAHALEHGQRFEPSLAEWLRNRIGEGRAALWQWSERALEAIEYERHNVPAELGEGRAERALVDALALCEALGLDASSLVPARVWAQYRSRSA
jgi:hypothetical protein